MRGNHVQEGRGVGSSLLAALEVAADLDRLVVRVLADALQVEGEHGSARGASERRESGRERGTHGCGLCLGRLGVHRLLHVLDGGRRGRLLQAGRGEEEDDAREEEEGEGSAKGSASRRSARARREGTHEDTGEVAADEDDEGAGDVEGRLGVAALLVDGLAAGGTLLDVALRGGREASQPGLLELWCSTDELLRLQSRRGVMAGCGRGREVGGGATGSR